MSRMARQALDVMKSVTEVQRLEIRPGDRVVVSSPDQLDMATVAAQIGDRVRAALQLPDDVPVVVLGAGMRLDVVGAVEDFTPAVERVVASYDRGR